MKTYLVSGSGALLLLLKLSASAATLHVDLNSAAPTAPYSDWATAATNIQDAVEAAAAGDVILVASGIYGQGGKVMSGDLTNRVALTKPVTLMSVNGPSATIIQGAWDLTATNGPSATRGIWLTNGSALIGFAIRGGATRGAIGDAMNLQSGGGIWCSSTNARIVNCIVHGNSAGTGGGVFRGTVVNSLIKDNTAASSGGGTAYSSLINSTVTRNWGRSVASGIIAAQTNWILNSIISGNITSMGVGEYSPVGISAGKFTNSCTSPIPPGLGNISSNPLFEADGFHLKAGSPCLNAGNSNFASGYDLDGQPWSATPSMGCDERSLELAVGQPAIVPTGDGKIRLRIAPIGATPENYWWFKDGALLANGGRISGAHSAEMAISAFEPTDAGLYHAVATNSFGSVTSAVVRVRSRFVDLGSLTPEVPYTNWVTAAPTIQAAVAAADFGDLIVVADGIHATGGRAVSGDLTNRLVINKAVLVTSLNGPTNAIIAGEKDLTNSNGNGNSAVRPVWMESWTSLAGFTIRNGATRTNGDIATLQSGGGVWTLGGNALVLGCVLTNNSAQRNGGGAFGVNLVRCTVMGNTATNGGGIYAGSAIYTYFEYNRSLSTGLFEGGGGAYGATLRNSVIHRNHAFGTGNTAAHNGGASYCDLYNCSVTENDGQGIFFGSAYNTVSWGNTVRDYAGSVSMHHSCANFSVFDYGTNNLYVDPQLVDPYHLSENSPVLGAGGPLFVTGTDFDGDPWLNPVSMGADEFVAGNLVGPLSVSIEPATNNILPNRALKLIGRIVGRASHIAWSFGDGPLVTNLSYHTAHAWTTPGDYTVTFTAFNDSNPAGVTTSTVIHVLPIESPSLSSIQKLVNPPFFAYQFEFSAQIGATNVIEYTTNLAPPIIWIPLVTNVSTNVIMKAINYDPPEQSRFYRLLAR